MSFSIVDLSWLPPPPDDFRAQVRRLRDAPADMARLAQQLAGFRLSETQLNTLGRAILERPSAGAAQDRVKLGVLSDSTTDILLPAMAASAARHRIWLSVVAAPFGQVVPEALDPASEMNRSGCDFILLALSHRGLPLVASPGDSGRAQETVESALQHLDMLRRGLHGASGAVVIAQTLPQTPDSLFGNLDHSLPGTMPWLIDAYNRGLRKRLAGSGDLLFDVAALADTVGLEQWHDPVQWAFGKFASAQRCVPIYADWLGRIIAAARGKSRKCLVLDLDNTLWGGVIGDDGVAGIVLGNGNPAGEAFLSVQQAALALRERGIVLAVSSKNDDAVARSAFRSHPDMLLKEDHIAVFQANWQDKATNLKAIAEALNIGSDALVFLDDNPAERAQVRGALPQVAVPELPDDPAYYALTLLAAGYFESVNFTADDRERARQYQDNASRVAALSGVADLDEYLRSLQMTAVFRPFDDVGRSRIAQLINKSNQFNLTTRRYTEAQVQAFEEAGEGLTLQVRLIDRFGDNGMISVVICVPEGPDWRIDTWLMSCRVLNRKLELAMLDWIVSAAKAAGVRALIGQYIPTERNGMVKEHYGKLGFVRDEEKEAGSLWRLDVAAHQPQPVPMQISSEPAAEASRG